MEDINKNLERKPSYINYKNRVSRLIPWFPRKKNEDFRENITI